jgi:hypothetical protein
MTGQNITTTTEYKIVFDRAAVWLWLSIAAALLAVSGT